MQGDVCVRVTVHGRVTGVGFRYATFNEAVHYPDLKGYVRNVDSRTVECLLQGEAVDVQRMVDWLHQGPPGARVTEIQVCRQPVSPCLERFRVAF